MRRARQQGSRFSLRHIIGGDEEARTPDPLRARQVLSQLSYTPVLNDSVTIATGPSKLNNIDTLLVTPFSHRVALDERRVLTFSLERR